MRIQFHPLTVARPAQWIRMGEVWRQRSIVLLVVCIVSFHSASVTNVFCLLQFLSTFTGTLESEDWCRVAQLSILFVHHFICSIEPSLLISFFLLQFLSTFTGLWGGVRRLLSCRIDQLSILFVCIISFVPLSHCHWTFLSLLHFLSNFTGLPHSSSRTMTNNPLEWG